MDLRRTKQRIAKEEDLARREMVRKRSEESAGLDLISELPDPLICLILSRLPFIEAVATSVISPRWKTLWKGMTRVEFDPRRIKPWRIDQEKPPICSRVDFNRSRDREAPSQPVKELRRRQARIKLKEFRRRQARIKLKKSIMEKIEKKMVSSMVHDNIKSCSIIHFCKNGIFDFLSKLNCLEELSLSNHSMIMEISQGFFQGNKLSSLALTCYKVGDGLFEGFVNLKTLTLARVLLVDESITLREILHRCPSLKNLILISCSRSLDSSQKEFIICSDKLNSIKLQNMSPDWTYNIECPNLKELSVISYNHENVRETLEKCSGRGQEIGGDEPIKHLNILCTILDLNNHRDMVLLAYMLDAWKNLQNIDITCKTELASEFAVPFLEFWDQQKLPKCISYQLRIVKMRRFGGKGQEISFASMLIRKASRLQQLVIECDDKCSKMEAFNTFALLSVKPRASDSLSIVLKPDGMSTDFRQWIDSLED